VPGTRYLIWIDAEVRTPSTEDQAQLLENAHTGFALLPYKLPRPPHKPYLYA